MAYPQYNRVVFVFTRSDIFAVTVLLALYGPRPSLCIVRRRNRIIYATVANITCTVRKSGQDHIDCRTTGPSTGL